MTNLVIRFIGREKQNLRLGIKKPGTGAGRGQALIQWRAPACVLPLRLSFGWPTFEKTLNTAPSP